MKGLLHMKNIYLVPHDDGTYEACIDYVAPTDEAVMLTSEGKYPVLYFYRRIDSNGSSVYEATECTNREELMDALNFSGKACHTVRWLWDFDSYKEEYHPVWAIFNAATDVVLEECAREITRSELIDYFESIWEFEDIWEKYEDDDGYSGYCHTKFISEAINLIIDFLREKKYCIEFGESTGVRLLDRECFRQEVIANDFAGIVQKIQEWNYRLMGAEKVDEENKKLFGRNASIIEKLSEKADCRLSHTD